MIVIILMVVTAITMIVFKINYQEIDLRLTYYFKWKLIKICTKIFFNLTKFDISNGVHRPIFLNQ